MKAWLLVLTLIFVGILVYSPHIGYPFPLHVDEYHHFDYANRLLEGTYDFKSDAALEVGYHAFLAGLIRLGLNIITYKYLAVAFSLFAAGMLFLLVKYLTGDFWAAWLSMLLYGFLPTNANLLGIRFATPLSLAIGFMFLILLLFMKGLKRGVYLLWCFVCFLVLGLIHGISAVFIYLVILIFCVFKNRKWSIFGLLGLALFTILLYSCGLSVIFLPSWTPLNPIFMLLGSGLLILGFVGLFYSDKIFIIWVLLASLLILMFIALDFTVFIPYQRAVYYGLVGLLPLAGIGARHLSNKLTFFLVLLCLFNLVNPVGLEIYHLISEEDYLSMVSFKDLPDGKVMSLPRYGEAISAISGKESFTGFYFSSEESRQISRRFFASNQTDRHIIMKEHNIKYVYDQTAIYG